MKQYTIIIAVIAIILAGGAYAFSLNTQNNGVNPIPTPETTPAYNEIITVAPGQTNNRYMVYSQVSFDAAKDKKRVLFFHAPWCPTCRPADAAFQKDSALIPESVVLFKTDYDTSADLKKKYGVTYQHTFVQVDAQNNEVTTWNGGQIIELVANVK